MDLRLLMELEFTQLNLEMKRIREKLPSMPAGSIQFLKDQRRWRWRQLFSDGTHKNLIKKRDHSLAQKLSEKRYLEDRLKTISTMQAMISDFLLKYPRLPMYPNQLTESSPEYRQLLDPLFEKRNQQTHTWLTEPFEMNPEYPERKNVPTEAGIAVRSKSEAIIANALWESKVPFRYEQAITLGDMKLYPDFTILNPEHPENNVLWEHFGMMDASGYARAASAKLTAYMEAGYIPGYNLITTYELKTAPLDIRYVKLLISYYFPFL